MISNYAVFEVDYTNGQVARASFVDDDGQQLGTVVRSATHRRTFWSGLGVDSVEFSCNSDAGQFLWRLYSERRGLLSGLLLSMAEDDAEAERWKQAQDQTLWTVGELGREHLAKPDLEVPEGDPRTLFFRLAQGGDRFRILILDHEGELWGSLEPSAGSPGHVLARWDGRVLGHILRSEHDATGAEFELQSNGTLCDETSDILELSVFEAAGLAAAVLTN